MNAAGAKVYPTRSADSPKTLRSCYPAGLSRRFLLFERQVIMVQKRADEVYFVIRRKLMKKLFGDREFIHQLFVIALPIGLQSAVTMIVNLIDSVMVGTLGDTALSSVNICSQFPYLYIMVVMGVANAGLIIASQAFGNNRIDKVKTIMTFCFKICAVLNVFFFLAAFLLPGPITSIYTNSEGIIETGAVYLKILSVAMLFQSYTNAAVILLRSAKLSRIGFTSSLIACFANVFFNWIFIFGNLGMPAMGVAGAAVGTVLARVAETIVVAVFMFRDEVLQYRLGDLKLKMDKPMLSDFIKIGTPSIISEVTGILNVSAAAMITGRVSEYYIAANTIVHNIWTLSSLFLFGMAMGANVMIGHMIGASRMKTAREYANNFIRISIVIGIAAAVLTQIIAPWISSFFNVSEQTLATAAKLTRAAGIAVFFLTMQQILTKGVLRGGGQAAAVTRVDLLSCWLVNIPVGFVVALVMKADPFWIYLSLRLDYLIKTVWALWKILKTDWIIRLNVD